MRGKIFFDTNTFIYPLTESETKKQGTCKSILQNFLKKKNPLVWSSQVAQELSFNLIKKRNLDPIRIKASISGFHHFKMVINDLQILNKALELNTSQSLSFWDSLILSSAISSNCSYLISEDMHHRQKIEGVKIVNPFLI